MQVVSALHTYTFIDAFLNIRAQLRKFLHVGTQYGVWESRRQIYHPEELQN